VVYEELLEQAGVLGTPTSSRCGVTHKVDLHLGSPIQTSTSGIASCSIGERFVKLIPYLEIQGFVANKLPQNWCLEKLEASASTLNR
jgi:hypothetical protein